jgi:hypothetical protein
MVKDKVCQDNAMVLITVVVQPQHLQEAAE